MIYLLGILLLMFSLDGKSANDTTKVVYSYNVLFYPEGGALLLNKACKVGFKVISRDGRSDEINGTIVDGKGNVVQTVRTFYDGLGYFNIYPIRDTDYFLKCENSKGEYGFFALPPSREDRYGVRISREEKRILVSVVVPDYPPARDSLYLLVQEGDSIVYGEPWNPAHKYLIIPKAGIRAGLSSVLLLDKSGELLSGRAFFHLEDRADLKTLPPDMRMNLLPILNDLEHAPAKRDQALDLLAQTLQIERIRTVDHIGSPDDIWKTIDLGEVEVRAFKKEKLAKGLYTATIPSSRTIKREEIAQWHIHDMRSLLSLFGGVEFRTDKVTRKYYPVLRRVINSFESTDEGKPLVVIDDMPFSNFEILDYPVEDVEEIFLLKGTDAATFGPKAANGVIVITTKRGKFINGGAQGK